MVFTTFEQALSVNKLLLSDIRRQIASVFGHFASSDGYCAPVGFTNQIHEGIPATLLTMLDFGSRQGKVVSPLSARHRAVKKALSFIHENRREPITVSSLCREASVNWRTLDYAFKEYMGVSPKKYLIAIRLNGVRQALFRATPQTSVTVTANEWGFWHMGQFASDYRNFFAELPSETLKKSL